MASDTPNLGLLKKNTLTDGNDTFNVKTMMNDNWDKVDGAVGDLSTAMPALGLPPTASVAEGFGVLGDTVKLVTGSYIGAGVVPTATDRKTIVFENEILLFWIYAIRPKGSYISEAVGIHNNSESVMSPIYTHDLEGVKSGFRQSNGILYELVDKKTLTWYSTMGTIPSDFRPFYAYNDSDKEYFYLAITRVK